jgi:membrane-bound metal-dependent hydrolase YbcI (DUF457 family)
MMCRPHESVSSLSWMVAVVLGIGAGVMTVWQALAGLIVAAGAGILPDFDHPKAEPAHAFPLVTKPIAEAVNWFARLTGGPGEKHSTPYHVAGHRAITHSLFATALIALAVHQAGFAGKWWTIAIVALVTIMAVRVLGPRKIKKSAVKSAAVTGLIAWLVWRYVPPGPWLWEAVTVGWAAHLWADMWSEAGVQLFWPIHTRVRIPGDLIPVDSTRERVVGGVCLLAVVLLCYRTLGPSIIAYGHGT